MILPFLEQRVEPLKWYPCYDSETALFLITAVLSLAAIPLRNENIYLLSVPCYAKLMFLFIWILMKYNFFCYSINFLISFGLSTKRTSGWFLGRIFCGLTILQNCSYTMLLRKHENVQSVYNILKANTFYYFIHINRKFVRRNCVYTLHQCLYAYGIIEYIIHIV